MRLFAKPVDVWESGRGGQFFRRLTLRRADGFVYLQRWSFGHKRVGTVKLHRMDAPDPGIDLHDHPWAFVSVILWGGYTEVRADTRDAARRAATAESFGELLKPWALRGDRVDRRPGSIRRLGLHECHTITELHRRTSWSLVITGPVRRKWGFYLPTGYMPEREYDATVRAERRDLWSDQNEARRPW